MNPLPSAPTGSYEETAVEMKLDKLTMKQLTDFLYLVESPEEMIRVRRISIVKMKESPEYLSAADPGVHLSAPVSRESLT